MMKNNINNAQHRQRAQSVLEYAMVIACLVGAALAMRIYVQRSIQGRIRDAADEIGEQYSAKTTTSSLTQTTITPKGQDGKEQYVTTIGRPRFIDVEVTDKTGAKHTEKREIMEIERKEPLTISIGAGSYEKTGTLSEEGDLFDDKKTEKK